MKKYINKFYLLSISILVSLILIIPNKVFADTDEYIINNYDINIVVNDNNTLKITETIGAFFKVDKHGIFRKIPLRNEVVRLDGTTSKNVTKISEINVSEKYSEYNENGYKVIKIGDEETTLTGQKNYTISYLYNLGKDPMPKYDELYFNIIGDEWDTSISNVTFTITMPKDFDHTKLGFSSGKKGTVNSSKVNFNVNGNVITGRLIGTLYPEEALTVRLELPEGYFVNASNNSEFPAIILIGLSIIFTMLTYFIWKKSGQDKQVIETIEFYAPKGLNSLEVGFLYKGKIDIKEVTSLLIYLANKGYIKISDYEEQGLFSKRKGFKITKLKEYDGYDINEEIFFNGLFNKPKRVNLFGKKIEGNNNPNEVTTDELSEYFYMTTTEILGRTNSKENKQRIFEKAPLTKKVFIGLMITIILSLITMLPLYYYGNTEDTLGTIIFQVVGFYILIVLGFEKRKFSDRFAGIIFGLVFGIITPAAIMGPSLLQNTEYLIAYIIGLICVIIMMICIKNLKKRNEYGTEILGKLKGFKTFLETVEKEKLESLVMENPNYFYDILPYTYVLGVSSKWINKFETISVQPPTWYDTSDDFDIISFGKTMDRTMNRASETMSSNDSDSSSGGGSSGGGSGGGGGGSW